MQRFYIDGSKVEHADFVVQGDDEGLQRGLAVFETLRTQGDQLFRAEAHVARLMDSVRAMGLPAVDAEKVLNELRAAVRGFSNDTVVRVTLTAGGRRLINTFPLDSSLTGGPLRVATFEWETPPWLSGRIKHCSRAIAQVARRSANVDEVFWLGHDGCFTEGTRSNIFAVVNSVVITPPDDGRLLCGVTRGAILEVARASGIPIEEAELRPSDPISELYASSTLRNLAPIVELNGAPGPGSGPIGEQLNLQLANLIQRECRR